MSNPIDLNAFLADLTADLDADGTQASEQQVQSAQVAPQTSSQDARQDQDTTTVTETEGGDGGNGGIAVAGDGGSADGGNGLGIGGAGGDIDQDGLVNVNFGSSAGGSGLRQFAESFSRVRDFGGAGRDHQLGFRYALVEVVAHEKPVAFSAVPTVRNADHVFGVIPANHEAFPSRKTFGYFGEVPGRSDQYDGRYQEENFFAFCAR